MEAVLIKLGISNYNRIGDKKIVLCCPVHGGDNPTGCALNTSKELLIPTWSCYTNKCECEVGKTLLHFVAHLLEKNVYETIKWLNYSIDEEDVSEYLSFINMTNVFDSNEALVEKSFPRSVVLKSLQIPAEYYILRNYDAQILEKYDVGVCLDKSKPMYNRVIIPVYDNDREKMVGCVGRSIFEKCFLCDCYHKENDICPVTEKERFYASKWKNSKGFRIENYLYNYWFAKDEIKKKKTVFLVEGAGDVWRFVEAGVNNVLAIFGSSLKTRQRKLLEQLGIDNLITFTDPDDAGEKCRLNIEKSVGRLYNISHIIYDSDPGDCTKEEILSLIGDYL